jgi:hypothetical protein
MRSVVKFVHLSALEVQAMRAIERWLVAFTYWLCRIFDVRPESLSKKRRGNLPPPEGGIAAY